MECPEKKNVAKVVKWKLERMLWGADEGLLQ